MGNLNTYSIVCHISCFIIDTFEDGDEIIAWIGPTPEYEIFTYISPAEFVKFITNSDWG